MIIVQPGSPLEGETRALLEQHHALMNALFPPGACHYLDLDALQAPHIRFLVAREGAAVLGTGALAMKEGYGEVKSMFTNPDARGKGVAAAILGALEDLARDEGLALLRLETGVGLDAAHRLYDRFGFRARGPFGDYQPSPHSLFFEKALD